MLMAAFSLSEESATSCAVPPTCAQLGYTMKKTDCGDVPIMRCPFAVSDDTQVYCEGTVKTTVLPILYGDGTVSNKLISGKTPIGVVFDETNRLAVALGDVGKNGVLGQDVRIAWSDEKIDTPLENCEKGTFDTCGTDGRKNTDILLKITTGNYEAAKAVNDYEPAGCASAFCKKGKWWLPSMKEYSYFYLSKEAYNLSVAILQVANVRAFPLSNVCYWASTEVSMSSAWDFCFSSFTKNDVGKAMTLAVKPMVKY